MTAYRLPYRYRRAFGYRSGRVHPVVLIAVAVALASGAGATAAGHHHGRIPDGGSYTPRTWARALLASEGFPRTDCNMGALTAWEAAEGGNWQNSAMFNPLNTTYDDLGRWESAGLVTATINSVGVRAYASWATGLRATAATLGNGRYASILAALRAGDDAHAVADAVAASPWGTGSFGASC